MKRAARLVVGGLLVILAPALTATTLYVNINNPAPARPYTYWVQAAMNIQDAIDAATAGDLVLVTNGVYATGGRAVAGTMINRVVIDKAIRVESVAGPADTLIVGAEAPGGGNGDGAIRCVYLAMNAVLSGFTLTNGYAWQGGGVWCAWGGVVTNCVLIGN